METAVMGHLVRKGISMRLMGWALAIALSGMLNLFLFGIMPGLVRGVPDRPKDLENIRTVQVVRVKRPEPPPRRKEQAKPPKPEQAPKRAGNIARHKAPVTEEVKPQLPFELNPRLPEFADSLVMPPLSEFSMAVPALKGLYHPGDLDGPLTPLATVPPAYPLRANRLGIQGRVLVGFTVTPEGGVVDVKILEAEPKGIFEKAAINCVSQWRFKPGTVDGIPVSARAEVPITFQLE